MQLKKLLKANILFSCIVASSLYANTNLEDILSSDQKKQISLSNKKAIEDSEKLKKDWISPVTLTYSHNNGDTQDSEKSLIKVNQAIFKSGGIFEAIKYANSTYDYSKLDIKLQKQMLIKEAFTLLYNINKSNYEIQKAKLLVKNANIDIIRKKEQVTNGFLDTSFLDNAILDANTAKKSLIDLQYKKIELINNFSNIASGKYSDFKMPSFEILSQKRFLEENIEIQKQKANIEKNYHYKNITIAKYLPSVNATFDYTRNHTSSTSNNKEVQNYGINITMPLDIRTFNDIESSKIDYLKSKLSLNTKKLEEENFFKSKLNKINSIDKKIKITKDDYKLYSSLLDTINEEKNAGLKTQSDVDTLLNSSKVKKAELEIFKIEKQIELLEIYSKLKSI